MKKIVCLFMFIMMVISVIALPTNAGNEITNEPYDTQIVGLEGGLVNSSMAYEGINVLNFGFNDPKDLFIANNGLIYVADKGNKVIYRYNPQTGKIDEIGEKVLAGPTGVCVDNNDNIYVADYESKNVYVFDQAGNKIKEYGRPTQALFGEDSIYKPTKVAVDKIGNLFITSEGNANGVIQINKNGEFVGYFGPNTINITLSLLFKRMFLSEQDKETYASLTPKPTSNVAIDNKNIVYTVVEGVANESLKKYNVNGTNLIGSSMMFSKGYKDIAVDDNGFIYTVSDDKKGVITVRDANGNILFTFGHTTSGSMSMGHFDEATGVDVDTNGNIWVLDGIGKNIQVFTRTKFATTVIDAMMLYNNGEYELAEQAYNDIISQNSSFVQAYIGLGNIALRNQDFHAARDYYKISNHKSGYSEAYWEIRDEWIGNNLLWIVIVVIILVALNFFKVKQKIYAKTGFDPEPIKTKIKNNSYYKEFAYLPKMMRHPNDTLYDIKFLQKIRFSTGLIFFALFVFINIFSDTVVTSYLFRAQLDSQVNIGFELLKWGLLVLLIVIGNFLVSSLQKGEGFFRDIFIGTMVAFAPILIFKLPIAILTNALTYNEAYILDMLEMFLWAWSILNVLIMIKTVHNYKLGELILNVILTAVAVIILVFLFLMIYILFMQFFQFIVGLVEEALLR